MDDGKRVGSVIFSVILGILWIALKAQRCSSHDDYRYTYTPPSYPLYNTGSSADFDTALNRTERALDELTKQDAAWSPAIAEIDPLVVAADPKATQCQALDDVVEQTPKWKVDVGDAIMVDDADPTAMAPFPVYIADDEGGLPSLSPESIARSHEVVEKIIADTYVSTPRLTSRDLLIQIGVMPKPVKGAKKIKGAPAPGKPIARGWIYDHSTHRVVCAGLVALPTPGKGDNVLRLTEVQIAKLVDVMPQALKAAPLPQLEQP